MGRGFAYANLNRRGDAIADFRVALPIDPSNQPSRDALARLEQLQRFSNLVSLPPPARSDSGSAAVPLDGMVTFKIRNGINSVSHVKFDAPENNRVWPNEIDVFVLNEGKGYSLPLSCQIGTELCFGGAHPGDAKGAWGVGLDGKHSCNVLLFNMWPPMGGYKSLLEPHSMRMPT